MPIEVLTSPSILPMARSFAFQFLSLAIRHPWLMAVYRHHFAFIILTKCHLRIRLFEEKTCFRFGIEIQSARKTLPDQMISVSPDGHLRFSAIDVVWHHFIFADTGIKKF